MEQQSTELNDIGHRLDEWTAVRTFWAGFETLQGRELALAKEIHAEVTHRIRAPYVAGIVPEMRIVVGGSRYLDILSVINVREQGREMELLCREVVG